MKINLIGNFKENTGLHQDASILRGLLVATFGDKVKIFKVPHIFPHCQEAELNIFIEVINPALFPYASKNVWIPNPEWTYKTWLPYAKMVDEIWVKTDEAFKIGWTSIDKTMQKNNYSKAIVLVGKNIFRNPKQLFRAYLEIKQSDPELYKKLPTLYVPHDSERIKLVSPDEKIVLLGILPEKEYDELLQECGLAICTSACEGFGHAVFEAMSTGSNLLLSPISPFKELAKDVPVFWADSLKIVDHPTCLGEIMDMSVVSIIECLKQYVYQNFKTRSNNSNLIRNQYEKAHVNFISDMKEFLSTRYIETEYLLKNVFPKEDELPDVSIITLTHNRKKFMPLAKYSYLIQSYPADKLEWVIIDDGESIEDELFGIQNVKYIRCEKLSIGEKRNLAIENAMYDIVVMMDDDDVYPENSILHRVAMMLKEPKKECAFCTTIPCYDIIKYSSFMNIPPIQLEMSQRVSEATLIFTKDFWMNRKFSDISIGEGDTFIRGREQMCRELSPQEVIVSLIHSKNTSDRKTPLMKEPNGCHYGFNEKLFALVSEIGESS